ncbi:MAG: tetratricopeptide repeat protein [Proteobacteria bacterium]|nr:tetratricopeptide repeat protein [Pseudomonadota bacterium]
MRRRIKLNPQDAVGYFQCGQAHFNLTYLHGARGNYYRAGTNGSDAIEFLEKALDLDPQLTDAKLHLGAAYYFADNLPPFVRAFSRLLWFIPQGNSEKSLPYLAEVTGSGDLYRDVASYLYAWVLLRGDDVSRHKAGEILASLVQRFPQSRRFQMRYLSYLVATGEYPTAVLSAQRFMDECPGCTRDPVDVDLARLWQARALLAQADTVNAVEVVDRIEHTQSFPSWAQGWHSLTLAQLKDIIPDRASATRMYQRVLDLRKTGEISEELESLALDGLARPFTTNAVTQ